LALSELPTCGSLYKKAIEACPDSFHAGFMCGQAEKVYSGACAAFMTKPPQEEQEEAMQIAEQLAAIYGLWRRRHDREIWLFMPSAVVEVEEMMKLEINSTEYHRRRAILCGIKDIDERFHERFK